MNKLYSLIILLFISITGFSQRDTVQLAEDLIYNQDFNSAIYFYKRIIEGDPKNPEFLYKLGFCYLNTPSKRDSSIAPLKAAVKLYNKLSRKKRKRVITTITEMKFYLARAYRVNIKFDSAITILKKLKKTIRNRKVQSLINNELQLCYDGKRLVEHPVKIQIKNLGPVINTKYTEHTPVISPDETELYFTSRKKLFPDSKPDYNGEYDENVYVSTKNDKGQWTTPKPIRSIDTRQHEATISISFDGLMLFIYKDDDDGSIYTSEFENDKWGKLKKLDENINTKYRETSASLSYDGQTLFFTSDRPGGYGGLDIYMSRKMPDGTWGKAINVGPAINTKKDEEAPCFMPDGKTLYFSSKGHGGLGGYDIFKDSLNEFGTWSLPQNVGYPINSVDDDVFFFPTPDEKRAYFASKKGDSYGSSDIYLMQMPEVNGSNLVVMTGYLTVCKGQMPHADIIITDNTTGKYYVAAPKRGKFVFVTKKGGSYNISVEVNEKVVFTDNFTVSQDAPSIMIYKAIRLDPDVPCGNNYSKNMSNDLLDTMLIGKNGDIYDVYVEIDNILFPLNKVGNIPPNKTLDTLSNYLKRNPDAVIEVGGYCDASGKAAYNHYLGLKRADAVKGYLLKNGVNPKQIVAISYGEENPIAINKNPDGTWNKEGQKYNRRVEFRVLKQGKESLLIYGMEVPKGIRNPNYKFNYKKAPVNNIETEN